MGIGAGELTERVTLQIPTTAADAYGQMVPTYTDLATVYAKIINSGGGEFYAAQKRNAETKAVIIIRYRSGLTSTLRVKHGNRYYEALHVQNIGQRNRFISIDVREVV